MAPVSAQESDKSDSSSQWQILSRLLPLNVIIFLGFMTVSLPLAVLPVFASSVLSSGPLAVGFLVGLQSIATVLSRPAAGHFADLYGPRVATLLGLCACTMTGVLYIASSLLTYHVSFLIIGRVILGLGESLILTGAITWGIAKVGSQYSGQVMSWNGVAMYGALAAGAPIGLFAYHFGGGGSSGFLATGIVTCVLPVAGLLTALKTSAEPHLPVVRMKTSSLLITIWPFGVALTMLMSAYGTLVSFYALLFESSGWKGSGLGFLGFGAAVVVVRLVFGRLPDKLGGRAVATWSIIFAALGQCIILLSWQAWIAIIGAIITGCGVSLGFPSLGIEAMRRTSPGSRGMVVAIFSAFQDLAFGISGPLAGILILAASGGPRTAFVLGAILPVFALLLLHFPVKHKRDEGRNDHVEV